MWQTLAGAWPLDRERLTGYLRKAMREAKTRTSWTDPDTEYESQVLTFAELVLDDDELTGQIGRFAAGLDGDARANALGAKLVQLTMPGVADTYQGCELAGLRLVDPDNRAPADFARRRDLLAALDAGLRRPAWTRSPGPGQAAGHGGRAAAAPGAPGLVRGGVHPAGRRGPRGAARGQLRPRRARGHRGHPAARRPAPARRLGRYRAAPAARRPLAGPADWCLPSGRAPAAARSSATTARGAARPRRITGGHVERVPGLGPHGRAGRGAAGVAGHGRRAAAAHAPGRHPGLVGGGRAGGGRLRHGLRVPGGRRRATAGSRAPRGSRWAARGRAGPTITARSAGPTGAGGAARCAAR